MIQPITHKKQAIKFRQWSGKSYAVFASIGKVINIGCVDIHISNKALEKNNHNNSLSQLFIDNFYEDAVNQDEIEAESADNQFFSAVILNQDDSSRPCRFIIHHNFKPILPVLPCRIRFFIVQILNLRINEKLN